MMVYFPGVSHLLFFRFSIASGRQVFEIHDGYLSAFTRQTKEVF